MKTTHKVIFGNSANMNTIPSGSIDLVITSPPYPMIEMWDEMFSEQSSEIANALQKEDGKLAFELMHQELDKVWNEVFRVLKYGGIACINIGDATRTIGGTFQLYSNHSRILSYCLKTGFVALPEILWRKQTNAPNKFMGSGMLPPSAYVTLEHEFILILRKGHKREFKKPNEKLNRQQSSFFWEERNVWFSDIWDLKGTGQNLTDEKVRKRSAAYPFELPYRLINMFSVRGDTVLDPYLGSATTMAAAMALGRNSIGIEIDYNFKETIFNRVEDIIEISTISFRDRINKHLQFVEERTKTKGKPKYESKKYGFSVMTKQEVEITFYYLKKVSRIEESCFEVTYGKLSKEKYEQEVL
ncbi:site-specific DNA-methyltransferase [bacterium]|nr:site-specific DNA-methyltransferase [bacterium]